MTVDLRKGVQRLAFLVWLLSSAALMVIGGSGASSLRGIANGLCWASLFSATFWAAYWLILWVVVGFTGNALPPRRVYLIVTIGCAIGYSVGIGTLQIAQEQESRKKTRIAESLAEGIRAEREVEERRQRIQRAEEESSQLRLETIEQRSREILAAYPSEAKDLARDFLPGRSLIVRRIGSNDSERRDPETAKEFLVACADTWIRRKCATALAEDEFAGGPLFDVTAESEKRARVAREEARRRAKRKEEREDQTVRIEKEQNGQKKAELIRAVNRTEMTKLLPLYESAGVIQHWCALNHNVTSFANWSEYQLREQCDGVRVGDVITNAD